MKHAWMLALLLGCTDAPQAPVVPAPVASQPSAPAVSPPPPAMVEAVLNPKSEVPPPPPEVSVAEMATADVLGAAGDAFDKYLEAAVNAPAAPPKPTVKLLSAKWCVLCPAAKRPGGFGSNP